MRTFIQITLFVLTVPSMVLAQSRSAPAQGPVRVAVIMDDPAQALQNVHYSLPAKTSAQPGTPAQTLIGPPIEDAESSPGSPPLDTDDPGTPGTGGVEVNFIVDCDSVKDGRSCQAGIDAAFGIGEKMQIRVSKYAVEEKAAGEPTFHGAGQTSVGIKYRFFDRNGLQIATFPGYQLDDATRRHNPDGTLADSDGSSFYMPVLFAKQLGKSTTIVSNIGYTANFNHPENNSLFTSIALGRALSQLTRVMAEVTANTSRDGTRVDVHAAVVHVIFPGESSRYRISGFLSAGKSVKSTDGKSHTTVRIGITVALKPATPAP